MVGGPYSAISLGCQQRSLVSHLGMCGRTQGWNSVMQPLQPGRQRTSIQSLIPHVPSLRAFAGGHGMGSRV